MFQVECKNLGAHVTLVDGLINDCRVNAKERWKNMVGLMSVRSRNHIISKVRRPWDYEIVEQLGWTLPDVILYPTGGGTGLVGMWKGFAEMEEMGLIVAQGPRMVSVQSTGCAPIVRAFEQDDEFAAL